MNIIWVRQIILQRIKRIEVYLVIAIILVSILQAIWLFQGRPFDTVDSGLQGYINFSHFFSQFYIWNQINYTGLISNTIGSSLNFILIFLNSLLFITLGLVLSVEIWFSLFITIGNLSIFFLLYNLLKNQSFVTKILAGAFAMSVFSFFTYSAAGPALNLLGIFFPTVMFFALLLAESVNNKIRSIRKEFIYFTLFLFSISFLIIISGVGYIIQNILAIIFPLILFSIFVKKGRRIKLFCYFIIGIILSIMIINPMLIGGVIFTKTIGNQFFNSGSIWIIKHLDNQNIFTSLQISIPTNIYSEIYMLSIFIFSILSIFYILKEKDIIKKSFIIGSFISFFVIVFIWDNFGLPFGAIFNILLNHFNELLVFRYSGSSLYYIVNFFYAIFGGLGIGLIYEKIKNYKAKNIVRNFGLILFVIFIVFLIGIRIYGADYSPYIGYSGIVIPQHVYSIANYINSQSGNFNVGLLPVAAPFMQFDSWYIGTDIYTYFINNPSFTGAYVATSQLFFPPSQGEYYNFASQVDSGNLSGNSVSNAFGVLGIKYIVVQGDTLHAGDENYFNFNSIYSNLNNSNNIFFVERYSNSSIYENRNYNRLVYASNVENLGNATTTEIFDRISNSTFNIQNMSVFATNITGFYNDSNTINATPISHFSKPDIRFVVDNPTQVTVHVTNVTTSFYLVYRETYDKHWAAYYSNGSEVNPYNHIAVNGFANAWYMNKTGNYTITLYYTLQTDADIMWVVSFAGLFAAIGIGVYGWRKRI